MHIILDYKIVSNQLIVCIYMHYQTFIALAIELAAHSSSVIANMQLSLKYGLCTTITCKQCYFYHFTAHFTCFLECMMAIGNYMIKY